MPQNRQFEKDFLQALCDQGVTVAIYLVNGIKLQGNIVSFDDHVVLLGSQTSNQMIFKHAMSTVVPVGEVNFEPFDQLGNRAE